MAKRDDLSNPRGTANTRVYDPDQFASLAERLARFLGTGRYLAAQSIFVVIWIALNGAGIIYEWDPYPFILLNLAFSTQAAYAAPLILLAQNRQDDRDRSVTERDREINARALAEAEFLAREIASIRLLLDQKADRDDIHEPIERLVRTLERVHGVDLSGDADDVVARRAGELDEPADHSN
jgi:uncharacterized membrane protein